MIPYKSIKCPDLNQASNAVKDHLKKCVGLGSNMTAFNS